MAHTTIHPIDLMQKRNSHTCIIDVRTAAEVKTVSLPHTLHIPLHEISPERVKAEIAKSGVDGSHIYLLCQAGRRAELAAEQLQGQIAGELIVIEGGMNNVKASNIPVEEGGHSGLPVDRQMRIAAGTLVLTGAALGTWVNPAFYGLSAFVGAGLVFAGITNICPMMIMLTKAPWNR